MPTQRITFWQALAAQMGPVSARERKFVALNGYTKRYDGSPSKDERETVIKLAAWEIKNLRKAGLSIDEPADGRGQPDGRWALLRELGEKLGEQTIAPFTVEGIDYRISRGGLGAARVVTITFDARLSKQALCRELTGVWPVMLERGWVRRSKPLDDRKLALVRFVCLDSEGATWRERVERWKERYGTWAYRDQRAMHSDFGRAEMSLTGQKWGLAWFYDPGVRRVWAMTDEQIEAAIKSGGHSRAERDALVKVWNARRPALDIDSDDEYRAAIRAVRKVKLAEKERDDQGGGAS